jgi:hypothetical protein
LATYPLVGLGEIHLNEQFHAFLRNLLPELPGKVDDIVVEFGNSRYQNLADRFILDLEPIRFGRLARIWRTPIGFAGSKRSTLRNARRSSPRHREVAGYAS